MAEPEAALSGYARRLAMLANASHGKQASQGHWKDFSTPRSVSTRSILNKKYFNLLRKVKGKILYLIVKIKTNFRENEGNF